MHLKSISIYEELFQLLYQNYSLELPTITLKCSCAIMSHLAWINYLGKSTFNMEKQMDSSSCSICSGFFFYTFRFFADFFLEYTCSII